MVPAVSIGAACGGPDAQLVEVLKEADAARYVAKRQGGNSCMLFEAPLVAEKAG